MRSRLGPRARGFSVFSLVAISLGSWLVNSPRAAGSVDAYVSKIEGLERSEGLLTFYKDPESGAVWLECPAPGDDGNVGTYLYYDAIRTGLGSNDVGLDRGQLGSTRVVELRIAGGKLLVVEVNWRYRARSESSPEQRAVEESFARSVLWAGEIEATADDGRRLVDWTSFLVRDAHDAVSYLEESEQGSFALDRSRSVVDLDECFAFPDNVELEALLTFASSDPGDQVEATAPDPKGITLVQHHSFVRLPDDGYRPRRFDPRSGGFSIDFYDYAAPLSKDIREKWILRHRLQKVNPGPSPSPVVEPIVYYVDRGAPEPVRSALVEGASWWAEAFERAGFQDAYRVELLPEGVHPLDVRYNVIQWVHRSTRGWSYGAEIYDPRTGEIIKGQVSLGSLRVRQDRLLFEGLASVASTGTGASDDPIELALARIRQLAAHEVGHTLGLAHNFAASTYGGRASVMDYPAPRIGIAEDGSFDFSNCYGVGVGEWDRQAIRYAYAELDTGPGEDEQLDAIVADGIERGLVFLSDADARPSGAAEPRANLWDNGSDPVEELRHVARVRSLAVDRFGIGNIASGRPIARLQEVFAPVYFHHRYQVTATAKLIGGVEYAHALRGDGQPPMRRIAPDRQRAALAELVDLLEPEALSIPRSVQDLMVPREHGSSRNREMFRGRTEPAFDATGAAGTAAELVLAELFQPERCARVVQFAAQDPQALSFEELVETVAETVFSGGEGRDEAAEIRRVVRGSAVETMLRLAEDAETAAAVRFRVIAALRDWESRLRRAGGSPANRAHGAVLADRIARRIGPSVIEDERPEVTDPPPPGSPIGADRLMGWGGCSHGARSTN